MNDWESPSISLRCPSLHYVFAPFLPETRIGQGGQCHFVPLAISKTHGQERSTVWDQRQHSSIAFIRRRWRVPQRILQHLKCLSRYVQSRALRNTHTHCSTAQTRKSIFGRSFFIPNAWAEKRERKKKEFLFLPGNKNSASWEYKNELRRQARHGVLYFLQI